MSPGVARDLAEAKDKFREICDYADKMIGLRFLEEDNDKGGIWCSIDTTIPVDFEKGTTINKSGEVFLDYRGDVHSDPHLPDTFISNVYSDDPHLPDNFYHWLIWNGNKVTGETIP
jgi:hypothetical protein